jgi:molybdopterin/thiamine biosynthesis adenylyltransferase
MAVDPLRHLSVFSPHAFGDRRVDIIGAGATGSRIAFDLAKLGVENIHVWDDDKVEEHNVANQAYGLEYVGMLKVSALSAMIKADTDTEIHKHNERVDGSQLLGDVVFLVTDTMSSRKEIWEKGLRFKLKTQLLVETRMGADNGRVYALNPNKPGHIKAWEATLYDDAEAEVSACGASVSVGPTAEIIAGLAVWQLIRWSSIEQGGDDVLDNEIIFSTRPMMTISRQF